MTCFLVRATRQRQPNKGMLRDPTAGIMLLIGQTPLQRGNIKGAASSHSRVKALNWSEVFIPSSERMTLLIGQLSFPQASGRDGQWPLEGSQDASVSCSVINHAQ